jgi:hypothetical protein
MEQAQSLPLKGWLIHRARIWWVLERAARPNEIGWVSDHLPMEDTNRHLIIEKLIIPVIWAPKLASKYIQTLHKSQWRSSLPKRRKITRLHATSPIIHNKRRMLISSNGTSPDLKDPGAIHIKAQMAQVVIQVQHHRHRYLVLSWWVDF